MAQDARDRAATGRLDDETAVVVSAVNLLRAVKESTAIGKPRGRQVRAGVERDLDECSGIEGRPLAGAGDGERRLVRTARQHEQ